VLRLQRLLGVLPARARARRQRPAQDRKLWGDGFEIETIINTRIAKANLRIVEVPSYEFDRIHGTSNLNTWRDGTRVLRALLVERLNHKGRHHTNTPLRSRGVADTPFRATSCERDSLSLRRLSPPATLMHTTSPQASPHSLRSAAMSGTLS
jgi:hypothetical protein